MKQLDPSEPEDNPSGPEHIAAEDTGAEEINPGTTPERAATASAAEPVEESRERKLAQLTAERDRLTRRIKAERAALAAEHETELNDCLRSLRRVGAERDAYLNDLNRVAAELEAAQRKAEHAGYLSDLQRVTADFANFRRQTAKRNKEIVEQAASQLAGSLLPVLDAFEAAANQNAEGVAALRSHLLGVLEKQGLITIGAAGEPFDPNRHEAVTYATSPEPGDENQTVAAVVRSGYAWNTRVLRPAMVAVRG